MPFSYFLPTKVLFQTPAITAVAAELDSLGAHSVLVVSDPGLAATGLVSEFQTGLAGGARKVIVFTDLTSNPTTAEVHAGLDLARAAGVQALVALGGGSAIDVAKGIALLMANGGTYADYQWGGKPITQRSLPVLAVPTTAGTGSEVSKVAVIVDEENPFKKGVLSPHMFPHAAIIDPELTRSLPPLLTAATGMDAFIHALESYTGRRAHPYTDQFALAALETACWALPAVVADGNDMVAREAMMRAALWGGTAMDHAGLGLIHALSGPLTGRLHLHHGLANALILPYALASNLPAIAPERLSRLNLIFGLTVSDSGERLVETLTRFVSGLGLPTHLAGVNRPLEGVDWSAIAEETTRMVLIQNNPRTVTAADVESLLAQMNG